MRVTGVFRIFNLLFTPHAFAYIHRGRRVGTGFPARELRTQGARHERRAATGTANPNTAYAVCVTEARLLIEDVFPADARPSARSRRGLLSGCRFAICACRCFWRCGLGLIFLTRVVLAVLVILAAFLLALLTLLALLAILLLLAISFLVLVVLVRAILQI